MSPRLDPFGPREAAPPHRGPPAVPQTAPVLRAPPGLAAAMLPEFGGEFALLSWPTSGLAPSLPLTQAEADVVRLLAEGRSNAEIARLRGTSARTVANQLASIFRKTGVHSRFELLAGPAAALPPRA